ncbi:MAG TPA: DUF2182 domain-containing protein [Vicinamibacterales bacterium]|nr:DUF2182 domain-containing protein [Vicinamibacterales bacterium]
MSDLAASSAPPRHERLVLTICLIIVTALAWAYLVRLERQMSAGMESDAAMAAMGMDMRAPWGTSDIALTYVMWVVMMIGMMVPSAGPVLLLFSGTAAARQERGLPVSVLMFGSGYLSVWALFGAAATLAQWGLHEASLLSLSMRTSSSFFGGAILIVAAVYQLSPLKMACLSQCRSPLGVLLTNWRSGPGGAFRMGAHHGGFCLGCCWALMSVLFVVGVMNLLWVAILGGVVLLEKISPVGINVARAAGALILLAGIALLVAAP